MSRLLWVGVGAAGGIYTYRRGQKAWDRAKERGVGGTAAVVAAATTSAVQTVRLSMIDTAAHPQTVRGNVYPIQQIAPVAQPDGVGAAVVRAAARRLHSAKRRHTATLG